MPGAGQALAERSHSCPGPHAWGWPSVRCPVLAVLRPFIISERGPRVFILHRALRVLPTLLLPKTQARPEAGGQPRLGPSAVLLRGRGSGLRQGLGLALSAGQAPLTDNHVGSRVAYPQVGPRAWCLARTGLPRVPAGAGNRVSAGRAGAFQDNVRAWATSCEVWLPGVRGSERSGGSPSLVSGGSARTPRPVGTALP